MKTTFASNKALLTAFATGQIAYFAKNGNPLKSLFVEGGTKLYSYGNHYLMAEINLIDKTARVNRKRYSVTTSKLSSLVSYHLRMEGFEVTHVEDLK